MEDAMLKNSSRFWLAVFVVGWFFDFLFWEKPAGISFPIFVILLVGTGLALASRENVLPARRTLWLLLPLGVFAVLTIIRKEPLTRLLGFSLSLAIMAVLAHSFQGGRWTNYSLSDYVVGFFRLAIGAVANPFALIIESREAQAASAEEAENAPPQRASAWRRALPVLRGLALALPIVALFAALLASADPVFSNFLTELLEIFRLENLPEYLFRGVIIIVLAFLLAGVYIHALTRSRDEKLIGEEKPWLPSFLGFTESVVVLASVDALFASFVAIQFRYFFGGQENINIDGYTYAEYARRGFGELVVVAFISLLLFLGLSALTRREAKKQRTAFSTLSGILVLLVGVMLVSAFQRLLLYEAAYGFTRLRTYSHVFMIWLGLLLVGVLLLEFRRKQRAFVLIALIAALGFSLTLNLLNVDAFITRQNVNRTLSGEALDSDYLSSLSNDAVPALLAAYKDPQSPDDQEIDLGAILACRAKILADDRENRPWQSFHWTDWRADRLLSANSGLFAAYAVQRDQDGVWTVESNGTERPCYHNPWD
jgi:Ca2+/Na+ antiporter